MQMNQVVLVRRDESHVGVVGEQRPAGSRQRPVHSPGIGARIHVLQADERQGLFATAHEIEAVGQERLVPRTVRDRFRSAIRHVVLCQQIACTIDARTSDDAEHGEVGPPRRIHDGPQDAAAQHVEDRPGLEVDRQDVELGRQRMALDPRLDAAAVRVDPRPRLVAKLLRHPPHEVFDRQTPLEAIAAGRTRAKALGEPSRRRAAEQIELPQSIGGRRVSLTEVGVELRWRRECAARRPCRTGSRRSLGSSSRALDPAHQTLKLQHAVVRSFGGGLVHSANAAHASRARGRQQVLVVLALVRRNREPDGAEQMTCRRQRGHEVVDPSVRFDAHRTAERCRLERRITLEHHGRQRTRHREHTRPTLSFGERRLVAQTRHFDALVQGRVAAGIARSSCSSAPESRSAVSSAASSP